MHAAYDVAVIGGGIAGLVAAIDAAKADRSVVLLEKSNRAGGRAASVRRGGALFNLGAHALYRSGEAFAVFREYGLVLNGGTPPQNGIAIWQQRLYPLPGNAVSLMTSPLLSVAGKMELAKLFMKLPKLNVNALGTLTVRQWVERNIRDEGVRRFFYALCRTTTYSVDVDRQLAGPAFTMVQRGLHTGGGVLYLDGGWQSIVEQLTDLAVLLGVDVRTGNGAAAVEHENGAVRRVRCADGSAIDVSQAVIAASPGVACKLVPGSADTALARWQRQARPSAVASLDLALRKLPVDGRDAALGMDRPLYFSNHSRVANLSDDGSVVVHLMKYHAPGESDPAADEQLLERTMSLLHPGWQKEVVARQYLPNIVVAHDSMHSGRTDMTPGPAVPEIRGLYVAGDWASHGESLVDAAAASGRRAAQRLVADASLLPSFR